MRDYAEENTTMRTRWTLLLVGLVLSGACGDDTAGDSTQATDGGTDRITRPDAVHEADGDAGDASVPDEADNTEDATDLLDPLDSVTEPDLLDAPDPIDVVVDPATDIDREDLVPTDDCEPLGIPERWIGTFEGDIVSNIPDMGGYTFQGPVSGEIRLQIWCINEKLVVLGELDGGSTNCVLANGCPFTASLDGVYYPDTQHMEGEVLDAVIDYSMVQVYAEGQFEGDLSEGPVLTGVWSGEKTGISLSYLEWVEASGEGTWEATPESP